MSEKIRKIALCIIALGTILFMVLFLALPKSEYSEEENRYLAGKPVLTLSNVYDGTFTKETTKYMADHFPFRNFFMKLKTSVEKSTGRKLINGVWVAKDGFYIEKYTEDTEGILKASESFKEFETSVKTAKVAFMFVPNAVCIYKDYLPESAVNDDELLAITKLENAVSGTKTDAYEALKKAKEESPDTELFYHLDHHWTTDGAYVAYRAYCETLNMTPVSLDDMTKEIITKEFRGTVYSKVTDVSAGYDEIVRYAKDEELTVTYINGKSLIESDSLYEDKYLEQKDKYSVFLNNINPLIEIEVKGNNTGRTLAIVKDSYANCFIPFLTSNFDKIYVFDTRYYRGIVSDFINENNDITDVLVLYNIQTLAHDTGVLRLK